VPSYQNSDLTEWNTFLEAGQMWDKIEDMCTEIGIDFSRDEDKKKFRINCTEKQVHLKVKFFEESLGDGEILKIVFIKKSGDLV
jgi:hypothetical protein